MEKKQEKINPYTSLLMGNLVDGVVDNDVDIDDPIIKYLVKNDEGWDDREDSDCDSRVLESDDSDIEDLIEEHILLERLKQVSGKEREECVESQNNSEIETIEGNLPFISGTSSASELNLLKKIIEEAIQTNLKTREELDEMEKKLERAFVESQRNRLEKMSEVKNEDDPKLRLCHLPMERFLDCFRSPYFKNEGSVAPWNSDSEKLTNTSVPFLWNSDDWSESQIGSLSIAVRKSLMYEQAKLHRQARRNKKRDPTMFTENDIFHLRNDPLYNLVKDRDDATLDWKNIANYVNKPVTEKDCIQMWTMHVKPSLREWTPKEHAKMLKIAKNYHLQDWDKISEELNTGRSAFECFSHHQGSFVLEWNDGKWSKEEEKHLKNVIESCKIGNYISWDKVTYFMDTKYVEQIYAKWHSFQAPHITKGPFSEREDRIMLGMIFKFGADLKSVSKVLKNRSLAQLTARYKDHLLPQLRLKTGEWTADEDKKLLELVKKYGEANWATIARSFQTRSRVQIRHRHKLLKKKLTKNPDLNLNLINRPKRPTSQKRICKNKMFYNTVMGTSGKNIKTLMHNEGTKQSKRLKPIDMKLTQYFQTKLLTENVNENTFPNRLQENSTTKYLDEKNAEGDKPFRVSPGKSLISSLIFSSLALRNFQETGETDGWSQKNRTTFYKGILELCTASKDTKEDLFKWHNVFCSLFTAPVLLSHVDFDRWKNILSKQ